ncbi:MAG: type III secretion system chaperone [Candidatus Spyradenecus sp.]
MTYPELLADFARTLGLDPLEPDETLTCLLLAEEATLTLQAVPECGHLLLSAPVAELPESAPPAQLRAFLAANYAFGETAGATLALAPDGETLTLCRALPLEGLTGEGLRGQIERFVAALLEWQARVRAEEASAQPPSPAEALIFS